MASELLPTINAEKWNFNGRSGKLSTVIENCQSAGQIFQITPDTKKDISWENWWEKKPIAISYIPRASSHIGETPVFKATKIRTTQEEFAILAILEEIDRARNSSK